MVFASCAKTEVQVPESEIVFQVAGHSVQTRGIEDYKDGYKDVPFGTYAFYKAVNPADNKDDFMANQSVSYKESNNSWAPTGTTYYWPKSGSIDFISYSPYTSDGSDAPAPVITEDGISYPAWNVNEHPGVDVMYSDKAVGQTRNVNTYNHGYEGVPTLFRHALAQVSFMVKAVYVSKTAPTGDITRWEIDIHSISLDNLLTTGTLELSLGEDGKWVKPESNVWDPETGVASKEISLGGIPLTTEAQAAGEGFLVLPQELTNQTVTITCTIRTYRDNNDGEGEKLVFTEENVTATGRLYDENLDRWGINQKIVYELGFSPSRTDPSDATEPIEIWFDPAVVDWENVTVTQVIQL